MTLTSPLPAGAPLAGAGGQRRATATSPTARWRAWALRALVGGLLALVLSAVAFHLSGGRWLSVSTPSMGTAAPVHTLVLTRHVDAADVRVGDVLTFHPPGTHETFTHRVIAVTGRGITTRGDINGASDPWDLHGGDLVGRVVASLWGVGWVVQVLPLLLVGGVVLWFGTSVYAGPSLRAPVRLLGSALLLLLATTLTSPFLGADQIAAVSGESSTAVSLVSTGLLPVRAEARTGRARPVDLRSGQTGALVVTGAPGGRVVVGLRLHLTRPQWVAMVLVWLSPLLWVLTVGLRPVPEPVGDPAAQQAG